MKPVKNFEKRINANRQNMFAVAGIDGSWSMHIDSADWLWIEPKGSKSVTHCMRMYFEWKKDLVRIHIIQLGKGTQYSRESTMLIQPENFRTFDVFKDWMCGNILNRKSYLTAL